MGSYSLADHLLPFLEEKEVAEALAITRQVAEALWEETGQPYRGIMYGGFMATAAGIRLLEYNARFGDPEAMNVLPLLNDDFLDLCEAMASGSLAGVTLGWERQATVCKYLVPKDYGLAADKITRPERPEELRLTVGDPGRARLYFSSVDQREDGLYLTGSRAIGVVGIDPDLAKAEQDAEAAAQTVKGWLDHRKDIGTPALINERVRHLNSLKQKTQ
jgi:phosphoribosylamine--glycine ligase